MRCEAVREYTLGQFLAAAEITWPTWAKWVQKGVAPRHYRIGMGRNIRIAAEEWSRWFQALERDRERTGRPYLRHPLEGGRAEITAEVASAGSVKVAVESVLQIRRDLEAKVGDRLTSDEITALAVGATRLATAMQNGGRS